MHPQKQVMVLVNILGGAAVLGSYAQGLLSHPAASAALWGGVPQGIRPFYTAGMLVAALSYFAFTYFLLFRLNPDETRMGKQLGFGVFNGLYATILVPSALWMPLTFAMAAQPGDGLWWAIRLVLGIVGLGSLGLLGSLLSVEPRQPAWAYRLAVIGSIGFCLQTVVLDALVWTSFYQI
jgi:hypothetical protein